MKKQAKIILTLMLLITVVCAVCVAAEAKDLRAVRLSVQTYPNKTVYGAFEEFDPSGIILCVGYEDGSEQLIRSKDVSVSYQQDDCFRVGDSGVILSYDGLSVVMPVTVNKICYDLGALSLEDLTVSYNGKYQSYNEMLPSIVGLDGIPLSMSAVGGSVDAGIYDIKVDFYSESKDYFIPDTRVVTMTVLPLDVDVSWGEASFIYDGRSKLPDAFYYDVNGNKVYPTVTGSATNAGKYTAIARSTDPNYRLVGESISYEIKKATYDFSGVIWSKDSFIYDGIKKSITVSGLPEGVSVIGYSGDIAVNAGKYTATASLSYDERNYNEPKELTHEWEIRKAMYDMSKTKVLDAEYVYDGKQHYPLIEGGMPIGADGISLEYIFSGGATHVSDGRVTVTVSFKSASKNYTVPDPITASVSIKPRGVMIAWGNDKIPYSGSRISPKAICDECEIKVKGSGVNVGKYTAVASTDNTDFYVINDTLEYEILRAKNSWKTMPAESVCYEGRTVRPVGEPTFGDPQYYYFSDAEGKNRITVPGTAGVYYAKISVPATENYYGIESEIITIKIVKIEAVSFVCEILRQNLVAFERLLADDLVCYVINNDGSRETVDSGNVEIIYENGDSLRRGDEAVCVVYGGLQIRLSVEVGYADYDLSSVAWTDLSFEYDGSPKYPRITGLPEGVEIIEYSGSGAIDAGKYTVLVVVKYDGENYNEPKISPCEFEIKRRVIPSPVFSAVYNGKDQIPTDDTNRFIIDYDGSFVSAGSYKVLARLIDSKNNVFENGLSECVAEFVIQPRLASVTVDSVDKFLLEKVGNAPFKITDGLIEGDSLTVEQYTKDGYVYLRSTNPNYRLLVTPGKINRLWYPSRRGAIILFAALIVLGLILAGIAVAFANRHRIENAFAMLRCRWQNRALVVDPPLGEDGDIEPSEYGSFDFDLECQTTDHDELEATESDTEALHELSAEEMYLEVDEEKADQLITDSLAKSLIKRDTSPISTTGNKRESISVDIISDSFSPGERVDINILKKKGLVEQDTGYIKIVGGGRIDKALRVYANDFSLVAVKMLVLTGGEAIKVASAKEKSQGE